MTRHGSCCRSELCTPQTHCSPSRMPLPPRRSGRIIIASPARERPMHDIVIRGGNIIDGTGKPAFSGDIVLAAGMNWEWESFPQYMDELDRRERAIDICAQIAHLPLRVYVMGDRAIRREAATVDDIAEMRRLTVEALRSGAFGFTTSRTDSHKTPDGELVPSRDADADELVGIGSALGAVGAGAFGMNSDFDDEDYEFAWMTKQARETGRTVWFLLTDRYEDPQRWRRLLDATHAARA